MNNPPVGLVAPDTDPDPGAKKRSARDPHFDPGAHKRIAVKIVDERGIESLKVMEVEACALLADGWRSCDRGRDALAPGKARRPRSRESPTLSLSGKPDALAPGKARRPMSMDFVDGPRIALSTKFFYRIGIGIAIGIVFSIPSIAKRRRTERGADRQCQETLLTDHLCSRT